MISSAEAAAYLRWTEGDELSSRFVSSKTRFIGNIIRFIIPKRFKIIARRRYLLSKALASEIDKHNADIVLDLGAGYNTLGERWSDRHSTKRFIEVDVEPIIKRKTSSLPSKKSLVLVAGDITKPAIYVSLGKRIRGASTIILLEGVSSYLNREEIDVCLAGIENILRDGGGVLITHQTTSAKEGQTLRSIFWGKPTETDVVAVLRHRGWVVNTKPSGGWTLVIGKFPRSTK